MNRTPVFHIFFFVLYYFAFSFFPPNFPPRNTLLLHRRRRNGAKLAGFDTRVCDRIPAKEPLITNESWIRSEYPRESESSPPTPGRRPFIADFRPVRGKAGRRTSCRRRSRVCPWCSKISTAVPYFPISPLPPFPVCMFDRLLVQLFSFCFLVLIFLVEIDLEIANFWFVLLVFLNVWQFNLFFLDYLVLLDSLIVEFVFFSFLFFCFLIPLGWVSM